MKEPYSRLKIGRRAEMQRRLTFYIIPVLIGLGGVVFSSQFQSILWRSVTLFVSVALPLYAAGNLIARYRTSRLERVVMLSAVLMLVLGAASTVTGLTNTLVSQFFEYNESINTLSRIIGLGSLFLGLFVVLFSMVRTGEDVEEYAERFMLLAEHISEGFVLSTAEGDILLVNNKFLEMFGVARGDVVGRNARALAQRFDMAPILEHLKNRQLGVASEYEITVRVGDAEKVVHFNGAPVFNRQQRHTATIATVRDITEEVMLRRRVEQNAVVLQRMVEEKTQLLEASQERFRDLLLSMNEGFLILDYANKIRFFNARMAQLLRVPEDSLNGRDIFEFVPDGSRSGLLNLLATAAGGSERGRRREIEFLNADGKQVPTVVAATYLVEGDRKVRGYSLVVTGIADIKKMEQKLAARARELERANEELRLHDRAKDGFLSNVSHELRTPLSTIQGYVELLAGGSLGALSEPQAAAVKVMDRNVERLLGLINEMIEFSRIQIRGIQLVYNLYRPATLAGEAVAAIHPDTIEKGIDVAVDFGSAPEFVWGDRDKTAQVLGILLNNAVKFTPRGGRIGVRAENVENGFNFVVSDSGIGIDPAFHQKIFDRFFQVDSSKTRQYEGTGIGLSIAKNIVESHGGTILVRSALGQGTEFMVHFPNMGIISGFAPEQLEGLSGLKVLVASERQEFADGLRQVLDGAVEEAAWTPGGYQAVRKAVEFAPKLIIVNECSSDVLGVSTLRLLRQNPETQAVPVVVLTMESEESLRQARAQWENAEFLVKPFPVLTLLDTLRWFCYESDRVPSRDLVEPAQESSRRYVFVIDSDPGLLEWVSMALKYRDIGCFCLRTPGEAVDMAQTVSPDAVFLDGDAPGGRVREMMGEIRSHEALAEAPLFVMTGHDDARERAGLDVAGVLRKPFSINEMINLLSVPK